jgi:hypothetical protein
MNVIYFHIELDKDGDDTFCDAPPSSLIGSIASPKVKTTEG